MAGLRIDASEVGAAMVRGFIGARFLNFALEKCNISEHHRNFALPNV
jgi:hypothetical protein